MRSAACWAALFFALCSCSHSVAHKQKEKKEVRLYLQANPSSLDPRANSGRLSVTVSRLLFEGLFRMDRDGESKPALAKRVTVSEDGCLYTFELHSSKWSNGEEVTAYDFEYAWKSVLDPSFSSPLSYMLYDIKNAAKACRRECSVEEVGVEAVDSYMLQVVLERPTPFFLELLAYPIFSPISRAYCEKEGESPESISNGPFTLKKQTFNSQILCERNPLYWGTSPANIDAISFIIVEDSQTAYNMFCKGDLDWFGDPLGTIPLDILHELDKNELHTRDVGQCTWLRCQIKEAPLSSKYIRKAIATAIDREIICAELLNCGEIPAQTVLAQSLSQLSAAPFKNGDVQEARSLFEQGIKELKITKESCSDLTLQYRSEDLTSKAIATLIQKQVESALGIKIVLKACDAATYSACFFSGDFQLCLVDWFTLCQDPGTTLSWFKQEKLGDGAYNEVLEKADSSVHVLDRQRYLKEAEEMVMEQLSIIPIVHTSCKYIKADRLQGEAWSPVGQIDFKYLEKTE